MKQRWPAPERNREPILHVLQEVLPESGLVLEIASGSGQHAAYFAAELPRIEWQPSDADDASLASVRAWVEDEGLPNLREPVELDVTAPEWPPEWLIDRVDAIFNANMIHIAPWEACRGLMRGAGQLLSPGAPLIMYGPHLRRGVETAPSNLSFDQSLRSRDPSWGIRWLHDVATEAAGHGLVLEQVVDMPANNVTVVYRKG